MGSLRQQLGLGTGDGFNAAIGRARNNFAAMLEGQREDAARKEAERQQADDAKTERIAHLEFKASMLEASSLQEYNNLRRQLTDVTEQ